MKLASAHAMWLKGRNMSTHVDQVRLISFVQVMYDGTLIEMSEFSHIASFIEFGGIDFIHAVRVDFSLLQLPPQSN